MVSRDDLSQAIAANPPAAHEAHSASDVELSQPLVADYALLWIGLVYPVANMLVLCFGVGAMGLLTTTNFYCFSFGLPILTVVVRCLLRLANILHYNWLAFDAFLVWMSLIGYLNMRLFAIAWAGV